VGEGTLIRSLGDEEGTYLILPVLHFASPPSPSSAVHFP
jgi:hypothetical protein